MSRIVIVTGANGALGSFVTRKFLANGDTVVGASRAIQASEFAGNFVAMPTEFADADSVQKLAEQTIAKFQRIDVLAHIAGGFAGGKPVHETDAKTWSSMIDSNLASAFNLVHAIVPHMRAAGSGRFIATGSHAAEQPHANLGAYVVSKSALVTLIKTVALENVDRGITANLVLPGTMDTSANRAAMPKADFSQWVSPADVADTIFWLASDAAAHVSGAAIPVAGRDL
jgi:NAD(P)-dependent dehydrogenase (short-subunit alcohol dehydrogenase family)